MAAVIDDRLLQLCGSTESPHENGRLDKMSLFFWKHPGAVECSMMAHAPRGPAQNLHRPVTASISALKYILCGAEDLEGANLASPEGSCPKL